MKYSAISLFTKKIYSKHEFCGFFLFACFYKKSITAIFSTY